MRTLMAVLSLGFILSTSVSSAGGSHDHGPKHSRPDSGYPSCSINYCPPAYSTNSYRPYYRTNRRFSVQVSWGLGYGGYSYGGGFGFGAGYGGGYRYGGGFGYGYGGGYGGSSYGYLPYNSYPTYTSKVNGVTPLPLGGYLYY